MSKNRRNFHYHYAEQYETRAERRARARRRSRFAVAPVALIPALVLLLLLGLMSTAFSSYVQSPDSIVSEAAKTSSALAELKDTVNNGRSAARKADLAPSGAQADLSDTSADYSQSGLADSAAAPDLSDSGANVDRAPTSATPLPVGMRIYLDVSDLTGWDNAYARFCSDENGNSPVSNVAVTSTGYSNRSYVEVPSGSYQSFYFQRGNGNGTWWNKSKTYKYTDIFETTVYIEGWDSDSNLGMANYVFNDGAGRVYFDNSVTQWSGKIYFLIGHSSYVSAYEMSQVSGTSDLYYYYLGESSKWNGYVFFGFAYKSAGSLSSSYSSPGAAYGAASGYTTVYSNFGISSENGTYVSEPNSSSLPTDIKFTDQSSGFNYFDDSQTLRVGANGTATISSYEMTGHGTTTAASKTVSASSNDSINAAKSAIVSVTPHPISGYAVSSVTLDGNALTDTDDDGVYTYVADGNNHIVEVTFYERSYCTLSITSPDPTTPLTLDLETPQAIQISISHHDSGNVTVTSAYGQYVKISDSATGTYANSLSLNSLSSSNTTATVYVKGVKPTTSAVRVTVACANAAHNNASSAHIDVNINACEIGLDPASTTVAVNGTQAVTVSASHHTGGGTVRVASGNSSCVLVASAQEGPYAAYADVSVNNSGTATVYVKGIQPTSVAVTVTATCQAHTDPVTDSMTVTVSTPTITHNSGNSYAFFYDAAATSIGSTTTTAASYDSVSYSLVTTNDGTDTAVANTVAVINAGQTTISGGNAVASDTDIYLKVDVVYNSTYSGHIYVPVKVKARLSYLLGSFMSSTWTANNDSKMDYSGNGVYTKSVWLDHGHTYGTAGDGTTGFKIYAEGHWDSWVNPNNSSDHYLISDTATLTLTEGQGNNMFLQTGNDGLYTFTYNTANHQLTVTYPGIQYILVSNKNNWNTQTGTVLSEGDTFRVTLSADDNSSDSPTENDLFDFLVYCNNGSYFGSSTTYNWENFSGVKNLTSGSFNNTKTKYNASYAGDYTFTFTNLSTSGCSVELTDRPSRTAEHVEYFAPNTTNEVDLYDSVDTTRQIRRAVEIIDNHNDTWTIRVPSTSEDNDYYEFSSWGANVTNSSTANGYITGTVTTSTSNTTVTAVSYWTFKTYTLTLYTRGATLSSVPGTSGLSDNGSSGDGKYYTCTYTYGTAVFMPGSMPGSDPFIAYDSSWQFINWYDNENFTGSEKTTLSVGTYGNITLYPKILIDVDFYDNVTNNYIVTETVLWNGTAPAPEVTDTYTGFQLTSNIWDNQVTHENDSYLVKNVKTGKTVYAIYKPVTEAVTGVFNPNTYAQDSDHDGVYEINFGAVIDADFTVASAYEYAQSPWKNITYRYTISVNGGNSTVEADMTGPSNGYWTASHPNLATMMTRPVGSEGNGVITISFYAQFEDARGVDVDGDSASTSLNYQIITPFQLNSFTATPYQRIYSASNSAPALTAAFKSYHTDKSPDDFTNVNLYKVQLFSRGSQIGSDVALTNTSNEDYTATLTGQLTDFLTNGVKYYTMEFWMREETTDPWVQDTFVTPPAFHTTVGTTESTGSRPVFLKANDSCASYGVMMLYIDSNSLSFQTGESFSRSGQTETIYRFNVPEDVTSVTFALIDTTKNYDAPTFSGSTITCSGDYYVAAAAVDLSGGYNSVNASYANSTLTCTPADL